MYTMKQIAIINGPNLNLIGKRETSIYGNVSFDSYLENLKREFQDIDIHYFQSNVEGEIIDKIQEVGFTFDGIIINAGAYTHTSIGIADAISAITTPATEVHISNTAAREAFRHTSFLTPVCKGVIMGFGLDSYKLALLNMC